MENINNHCKTDCIKCKEALITDNNFTPPPGCACQEIIDLYRKKLKEYYNTSGKTTFYLGMLARLREMETTLKIGIIEKHIGDYISLYATPYNKNEAYKIKKITYDRYLKVKQHKHKHPFLIQIPHDFTILTPEEYSKLPERKEKAKTGINPRYCRHSKNKRWR